MTTDMLLHSVVAEKANDIVSLAFLRYKSVERFKEVLVANKKQEELKLKSDPDYTFSLLCTVNNQIVNIERHRNSVKASIDLCEYMLDNDSYYYPTFTEAKLKGNKSILNANYSEVKRRLGAYKSKLYAYNEETERLVKLKEKYEAILGKAEKYEQTAQCKQNYRR